MRSTTWAPLLGTASRGTLQRTPFSGLCLGDPMHGIASLRPTLVETLKEAPCKRPRQGDPLQGTLYRGAHPGTPSIGTTPREPHQGTLSRRPCLMDYLQGIPYRNPLHWNPPGNFLMRPTYKNCYRELFPGCLPIGTPFRRHSTGTASCDCSIEPNPNYSISVTQFNEYVSWIYIIRHKRGPLQGTPFRGPQILGIINETKSSVPLEDTAPLRPLKGPPSMRPSHGDPLHWTPNGTHTVDQ
jgi:hypothetical protein